MKVECHLCQSNAKITHRQPMSTTVTTLYCDCSHCHHRFTMSLSFDKTILPPAESSVSWLKEAVQQLSRDERQQLLAL